MPKIIIDFTISKFNIYYFKKLFFTKKLIFEDIYFLIINFLYYFYNTFLKIIL